MTAPRGRSRGLHVGEAALLLLGTGAFACATPSAWLQREGCPVVPVSTAELSERADLRARVRMQAGNREIALEVVARAQPDGLIVIGLDPAGIRLFTVHQRGRDLDVDAGSSAELRILALWVMDGLHRAYWIESGDGDPQSAGERNFEWGGESVRESQQDGRRRRVFRRGGPDPAPGVTIDYPPAPRSEPAGPVEIRSEWCGYEAVVAILDE